MEAKDTVMKDEEIMKLAQVPPEDFAASPHWWLRANQRVAERQAEISFKAGIKEAVEALENTLYWITKGSQAGDLPGSGLIVFQLQQALASAEGRRRKEG